ncbi:MAG: hypothetical protein WBM98_14420, partial [Maribacter sp.]|uniref:hypothetical protein n=1 Tax=Maribacter sp. TaxID=1897614 RepID=UPI003C78B2F6
EVSRAYQYPPGTPYTNNQATTLLENKLSEIILAEENVSILEEVESSFLVIFAYDSQHSDVLTTVWNGLSPEIKTDITLVLISTEGLDEFIYQ